MSDVLLRKKLIRLAQAQPELRSHLMPLIRGASLPAPDGAGELAAILEDRGWNVRHLRDGEFQAQSRHIRVDFYALRGKVRLEFNPDGMTGDAPAMAKALVEMDKLYK